MKALVNLTMLYFYVNPLFFCTLVKAQEPKLIGKKTIGNATEFTYEVSGEDIKDPKKTTYLYGIRDLAYALCSKVLCPVDKDNPNTATCVCPIYGLPTDAEWQKDSVGPNDLAQTQPTLRDGKLETVVSNYSMANTEQQKAAQTTCQFTKPTPWANCFGVRCYVKYKDDGTPVAVCKCPLEKTETFVSIGPKTPKYCTKKAPKKAWSAATKNQDENNRYIIQKLYQQPK